MFEQKWLFGTDSKPPKWLLKEFANALRLMSRNRESVHLFDTGKGPAGEPTTTFVIAICRSFSSEEMARRISIALDADIQPSEIPARVVNSKEYNAP